MPQRVTYELRNRVALIGINRRERRNAIDRVTAVELREVWRRFDADAEADIAVLWGAGGHFSAGADLSSFDLVDLDEGYLGFTRMSVHKPTIAAVEGYCVAGGLEMALWCDLRVAAASAVFGCFERRYGVPLVDGGTQRLPRVVGMGRALEMILTGREVGATEALAIGLANQVVEDGAAVEAAVGWAETIGAFPQETVRSDRAALYRGIGVALSEGLEIERTLGNAVLEVAARGAAQFRAHHEPGDRSKPLRRR